MYKTQDLLSSHAKKLGLVLVAGREGLNRRIKVPEAHRPGLTLAGHLKNRALQRIVLFGRAEVEFLHDLPPKLRVERLKGVFSDETPAIIIARNFRPPDELLNLCEREKVPLLRTHMTTMNLLSKLTHLLTEEFAPTLSCHGTLVEVFGVGVLIQGDSAVGKSEAALGLIEKGHRLVSDDLVKVKKKEGVYLEGFGAELSRHHMEVRGIGIINVANLYGAVCVCEKKSLDIVVKLENWNDEHFYDRVGLDEKKIDILGVSLPFHVLPVKPGRDVVLMLETIALNHRLKAMGYHSAKEFNAKQLATITKNQLRENKGMHAKSN